MGWLRFCFVTVQVKKVMGEEYKSRMPVLIWPGLDAVLHISRNEFNEFSSCEVWRRNQFRTANLIWIGLAIFPAYLSRE